jgi:hypothetical protein
VVIATTHGLAAGEVAHDAIASRIAANFAIFPANELRH